MQDVRLLSLYWAVVWVCSLSCYSWRIPSVLFGAYRDRSVHPAVNLIIQRLVFFLKLIIYFLWLRKMFVFKKKKIFLIVSYFVSLCRFLVLNIFLKKNNGLLKNICIFLQCLNNSPKIIYFYIYLLWWVISFSIFYIRYVLKNYKDFINSMLQLFCFWNVEKYWIPKDSASIGYLWIVYFLKLWVAF